MADLASGLSLQSIWIAVSCHEKSVVLYQLLKQWHQLLSTYCDEWLIGNTVTSYQACY